MARSTAPVLLRWRVEPVEGVHVAGRPGPGPSYVPGPEDAQRLGLGVGGRRIRCVLARVAGAHAQLPQRTGEYGADPGEEHGQQDRST